MSGKFDVIVIGLGAVGAATAYRLAKAGVRVLGLDRYAPPHTLGSSHGETRITRFACGEGVDYTPYARRSHEIWRQLERDTGQQLLVQNGLLVISGRGERSAAHGNREFLATTIEAARRHGVAHELLDDAHIRRRFPAFNIADGDEAYFEPEAGFLFPERCVTAQLDQARKLGATLKTNEAVTSFTNDKSGIRVITSHGEYSADKLVIAAGPWLPKLVPGLSRLFTIRRQVLAWFRVDKSAPIDIFRPGRLPVFYWQIPRAQAIYGFPSIDGETMKIATEQYDTATTPEIVDRTVSPREIAAMHRDYVAPFFPAVSADCVRTEVCLYTCVDHARFIIDTLPDDPRVIVASPCSGHGFKHSAAIGEAVAELARFGQPSSLDLRQFRMPS